MHSELRSRTSGHCTLINPGGTSQRCKVAQGRQVRGRHDVVHLRGYTRQSKIQLKLYWSEFRHLEKVAAAMHWILVSCAFVYPARRRAARRAVPADVRDVLHVRRLPDLHLWLLRICDTRTADKVNILITTPTFWFYSYISIALIWTVLWNTFHLGGIGNYILEEKHCSILGWWLCLPKICEMYRRPLRRPFILAGSTGGCPPAVPWEESTTYVFASSDSWTCLSQVGHNVERRKGTYTKS